MINLTPAQQQLVNIILLVLSSTGVLLGQLLVKQGIDQTTLNALATWATTVGPLAVSAIVAYIIHTPQAAVATAGKVDGAEVHVDTSPNTSASAAVIAVANSNDPATAGVVPAKAAA